MTDIQYFNDLYSDFEQLVSADSQRASLSAAGRERSTRRRSRHWKVALVLAVLAATVPVAAYAGVSPIGWLHGSPGVVTVPKVTLTYVQTAESAIRADGLRVEIASVPAVTDADAAVNGYAVSGQSPRAGTHVPTGTLVLLRLVVSFNFGPGGVGTSGTVPNLVGMPINRAMEAATSVGLRVTVPAVKHAVPSDSVTAQSITAGSQVGPNSVITLTLG